MPKRIQLRRSKGWRKPEGAVVVSRPTAFGNPFSIAIHGRERAVELYRELVVGTRSMMGERLRGEVAFPAAFDIDHLRGKDLACWCPQDQPCHADVLLEIANR